MKRLVVSGLPCPTQAWERFLPGGVTQRIVTVREVFERSPQSSDLRALSRYVSDVILQEKPDSIVCHDLGVPLTLIGLWRLQKKGYRLAPRVTAFNGAFRGFNVFKAGHMLRVQLAPLNRLMAEVRSRGGEVDDGLKPLLPRIRAMFRYVALFRMTEQFSGWMGLDEYVGLKKDFRLLAPIQVIASRNDPYIPIEAVRRLGRDFHAERIVETEYGHFPYSGDREKLVDILLEFESAPSNRAYSV